MGFPSLLGRLGCFESWLSTSTSFPPHVLQPQPLQSRILGLAPATKPSGLDVREDLSDDFAKVGCAEWAATGKALTVLPE